VLCGLNAIVLTEDSISDLVRPFSTMYESWTFHSRLYAAARIVAQREKHEYQPCHLSLSAAAWYAIKSDETRAILEAAGKLIRIYRSTRFQTLAQS
jgi:predicted nucleotide-binding protein (sugar kinase/HSP70/actin superfamily)